MKRLMIFCKQRMWINAGGGLVISATPCKIDYAARKAMSDEMMSIFRATPGRVDVEALKAVFDKYTPSEHDLEAQAGGMRQWTLRVKFAHGRFVSAKIGIFWIILPLTWLIWRSVT